jgi:chemotaxis protein methyltransferase CheR
MTEISKLEFDLLKKLLADISGIDVQDNKRYLFTTRLSEYLREKGFSGFSELYNRLTVGNNPELRREFVQSMTTHESSFFRDAKPFNLLMKALLPSLAAINRENARFLAPRIRILSAGCSLGQEPYTIAMCVKLWLETQKVYTENDITIIGIDISQRVLGRAKKGEYAENEIGTALPAAMRSKFFVPGKTGHLVVGEPVRAMVKFEEHNLVEPLDMLGRFDIIFCRNVIIYFPIDLQRKILSRFADLLQRHGVLIMGSSESTFNLSDDYDVVHAEGTAYFKPKGRQTAT